MFDHEDVVELSPGESCTSDDDVLYQLTCDELSEGWVLPDRELLPVGLEALEPGPVLGALVSVVDRSRLNGHDAVRLMTAEARLSSHFEALKLASMVEVALSPSGETDSGPERAAEMVEYAADEIAAALHLTRRAADRELELAWSLGSKLKRVWDRFSRGLLDLRRVRVFEDVLGHVRTEAVTTVSEEVLEECSGLTTGQLRARLTRELVKVDPEGEAMGYQAGIEDRKVVVYSNPDQTATIQASNVPPERAAGILARVNKIAQSLKMFGETRSIDQLRADVFLGLLEGADHTAVSTTGAGGGVHLTVELATLADLSHMPGELAGYGPVLADIARQVAKDQAKASWDYILTNNGAAVATGPIRRRPNTSQKRQVTAHYPTCVHPGCRMPTHDCDLDHRHPWAQGGHTHTANLQPLCRHHHMLKHHTAWQLSKEPSGDHEWTSPLKHSYITKRGPPGY